MSKNSALVLVILLVLCSLFITPGNATLAQSNIQVTANNTELDFPNNLTIVLEAQSTDQIKTITLEYGTNARTCVKGTARQQIEVTPDNNVSANWEWDFKDSGSLPPGAEVWWQWELADSAGNQLKTEVKTLTIEDNRLDWNTLSNDQVNIVWSEGSRSFGQDILDIATQSLDRLQKEAGIRPPGKIRLTIFPSYETLRAAGLFLPEWTGGAAFPEYSTTMIGLPVDSKDSWLNEVIPHELTHLVSGTLVYNCLGVSMPNWLSEGLSIYAEGEASSKNAQDVLNALEAGTLPPLHNLEAEFSANYEEAVLSYTQSGDVIRFLIETYGPEKMNALLAALQSGKTIDPALQQVYNLDTDGLDNAWRASLGFAGVTSNQAAIATSPAKRTAVPTLALWTPAFGQSGGGPTSTPTPAAVAAGPTITLTPCGESTPCTPAEESLATPTSQSIGELASTALPAEPPKRSPISCLGGNLAVALLLVSIFGYLHLVRRLNY